MANRHWLNTLPAVALCCLLTGCGGNDTATTGELSASAVAANNQGVGLMGQYDYDAARASFAELVQEYPGATALRLNLAIATLNRQQEGDEAAAQQLVDEVLAAEPRNDRARYCAGLLAYRAGNFDSARQHFSFVSELDPQDAYAAYFLGETLAQSGQPQQALQLYRQAMEADPYLRSAYYAAFRLYRQQGDREPAQQMFEQYQRLENNPRAAVVEFKYTRMGSRCEAVAVGRQETVVAAVPEGPLFDKPVALLPETKTAAASGNLTAADISGDGRIDLLVSGAGQRTRVVLATDGGYTESPDHPLAAVADVNTALWGDYDNDGLVDVYFCRRGQNQLWHQSPAGHWVDVTASTGTGGGAADTVDGAMLDADHDGDLDLFLVNADAPNELLNNNLDGSFRPIAKLQGITGDGRGSRAVLVADLDNDRDTDLVVLHRDAPLEAWVNHLTWEYRKAQLPQALVDLAAQAIVAGDTDANGDVELFALTQNAVQRWQRDTAGEWKQEQLQLADAPEIPAGARMGLFDLDGDGRAELVLSTATGWSAYALGVSPLQPLYTATPPDAGKLIDWLPVLQDPARGLSIAALDADGRLWLWKPGTGRHGFVALDFRGKEEGAESIRSNLDGIGTRFMARRGSTWIAGDTFRHHSGPGQGRQPQSIGLGGADSLDFVSMTWSNGVLQTELALAGGAPHVLRETERQLASCPILFAWDGKGYGFVSDLLGVGGIGFAIGPGEYAPSRPWENFLFPQEAIKPRDGRYLVKITEPMEEVAYLDAARLVAYDLPQGWNVVPDERMGTGEPEPSGRALFYKTMLLPAAASNDRGEDVTALVNAVDLKAAPVGNKDARFIGLLQQEHVLTLEFSQPLDGYAGDPLLLIDGWVEYPYSQTSFAAWQAMRSYVTPTLEARLADGSWQPLLREFGYPAGMPRQLAVPLPALPAGTRALRLRTNMEIYWDRIALAFAQQPPSMQRIELPLQAARVAPMGFPLRSTGPQRQPGYDYQRRKPYWDTRHAAGNYTAFGPATELVAETDDAVAIIGPGEEVHLEFAAPDAAPPPGWTRRILLETNGWAKDMDLYTRDGTTVAPLPAVSNSTAVRDSLHAKYNTRYQSGY